MKIINAHADILFLDEQRQTDEVFARIETAGRTCYKSEANMTPESARAFARKAVQMGHESVLEHGFVMVRFTVDRGVSHEIVRHRIASYSMESTRYCVSGDTIIRGCGQKKWTVKQLFDWQNDPSRKGRLKLINVRSVDETTNIIVKNKIEEILSVGEKKVFEVVTESGRKLVCTADHEIYTPNGYIALNNLCVGEFVYSNGLELLENEDWIRNFYIKNNHTRAETAKEIGCCESYVYKAFKKFGIVKPLSDRPNRKPGYGVKGMFSGESIKKLSESKHGEKNPNYIHDRTSIKKSCAYSEAHRKYGTEKEYCEFCGSTENIEIHHIDKDPKNNERSNIKMLCCGCHKAVHRIGKLAVFPDKIVSITEKGTETVYDIRMCEPYHNFVADGIVVHNCNYSKDKFGNEVTFIMPCFFMEDNDGVNKEGKDIWETAMEASEAAYLAMLNKNCTPQEARSVLPNSLKTEVVMTANIREWRNFFRLRACGEHGAPHPQMLEVAVPLLMEFRHRLPELFEDIVIPTEYLTKYGKRFEKK